MTIRSYVDTSKPSAFSPNIPSHLIDSLFQRIALRPPYFAFTDLRLSDGHLRAEAVAQTPAYGEQGPMTAAELGRHAAIAGLSHVALEQKDIKQRYYLAQRAECTYHLNSAPYGSPVLFDSTITERSKRGAVASVHAFVQQMPLAEFSISYTTLPSASFTRLFKQHERLTSVAYNPYTALPVLTYDISERGDQANQWLRPVPAEFCIGHFPHYPALPVAVLMGQLSYLAGRLLGSQPRYRVLRGLVEAQDLCWVGDEVHFQAQQVALEALPNQHTELEFLCKALVKDREVAGMQLWLESLNAVN